MKSSDIVLDHAAHHHGLIRITEHPHRARTIRRMAARGTLTRLLPGVYALKSVAHTLDVRTRAVTLWDPNAIITGDAAAALAFGSTRTVATIDVTRSHWAQLPTGYRCHKGRVPPSERVEGNGTTRTSAAWTAVWMAGHDDGETIELALRTRRVTPRGLIGICVRMARTPGQRLRRFVVACSQSNPWSAAERLAHRALLDAGITGWFGNWPISLGGTTWPIDIAFPKLRLVFEIDGFEFHNDRRTFEWDHEKANRLTENNWTVFRITWQMLQDKPAFLARIRAGMAVARARLQTSPH
ncbi:MAG TPA: type IV toxin-antitoxin system AbiEi family antitoxin domain-containing protein [Propionibacteriaceae bacterium]|nr:type IV toxin-antitoxin system AbiEi family antitoxin domain-containing protein [Propionibacteriaceae bacterium]